MQATGHLVGGIFELAARMQNGEHHFSRGPTIRHRIDRDAAAVVDDGDRVIDVDRDVDLVAKAGERFVDRVVDDLVDEMMESRRAGRPHEHRRPLPHGLELLDTLIWSAP